MGARWVLLQTADESWHLTSLRLSDLLRVEVPSVLFMLSFDSVLPGWIPGLDVYYLG